MQRDCGFIYSPRHVKPEDAVNWVLKKKYRPTSNSTSAAVWKYEFSCQSLQYQLWLGAVILLRKKTTMFFGALGCPNYQVPLYNGKMLASGGSVTLFQWIPQRNRARIVQTIHHHHRYHHHHHHGQQQQELGRSLAMSSNGMTLALVTTSKDRIEKHNNNHPTM
jgi:hypothetical protein